MNVRTIRTFLWAVVAVAGLAFGTLLYFAGSGHAPLTGGDGEPYGSPFSLVDQHGRPADETLFRGRPTALFFGFTHCTDECPATLMEMVAWREALGTDGADLQLVFVTVDPERDTPDVLRDYLEAFAPDLIGLTGAPDAVADMVAGFHIYARKAEEHDHGSYQVAHTASVLLLDAKGRLAGTIPYGESRDTAVAKLRALLDRAPASI